jgi:hypothetical protein
MIGPNNNQNHGRKTTFLPPSSILVERRMHQRLIKMNKGVMEVGGTSGARQTHPNEANKHSYRNNYKGKHPMTRT